MMSTLPTLEKVRQINYAEVCLYEEPVILFEYWLNWNISKVLVDLRLQEEKKKKEQVFLYFYFLILRGRQ